MAKASHGFTILELILAIVLVSVCSTVIFSSLRFFFTLWDEAFSVTSQEDRLAHSSAMLFTDIKQASRIVTCTGDPFFLQLEQADGEQLSTVSYYIYTPAGQPGKLLRAEGPFDRSKDYGQGIVLAPQVAVPPVSAIAYDPSLNLLTYTLASTLNEEIISVNCSVRPFCIRKQADHE